VTSAVACKIAIDQYGADNCRVIFIDTKNEDEDSYRFLDDCSTWLQKEIEVISAIPTQYLDIEDVWETHKQLNTANGAICSYKLKRCVRELWEKGNEWSLQVFGFEFDKKEFNRAQSFKLNHAHTNPIFPLLFHALTKSDCIRRLNKAGVEVPRAYKLGFHNNNCLKTGCITGGIGYWQKIQRDFPEKFDAMAGIEHKLTNERGYPVTMLKCQSRASKEKVKATGDKRANLVFLKAHPDYPDHKTINDMVGRAPEPLGDCNGFCGVEDLSPRSKTEREINFDAEA